MGTDIISRYAKLNPKSISVLLEDKGGKTGSDGHAQTVSLFLGLTVSVNVKLKQWKRQIFICVWGKNDSVNATETWRGEEEGRKASATADLNQL